MYYSNEALNPRPKRGRPPKQAAKPEIEPQVTVDIFMTVVPVVRPFLFTPEISATSAFSVFSSKFDTDEDVLQSRRQSPGDAEASLSQKLASLRALSSKWVEAAPPSKPQIVEDVEEAELETMPTKSKPKLSPKEQKPLVKSQTKKTTLKAKSTPKGVPSKAQKKPAKMGKPKAKRIMPRITNETSCKKKVKMLKKILPRKS